MSCCIAGETDLSSRSTMTSLHIILQYIILHCIILYFAVQYDVILYMILYFDYVLLYMGETDLSSRSTMTGFHQLCHHLSQHLNVALAHLPNIHCGLRYQVGLPRPCAQKNCLIGRPHRLLKVSLHITPAVCAACLTRA